MKGYKILDSNFQCRGFQYRVGETAVFEGPVVICRRGLHFCRDAMDCVQYYKLDSGNRYAEVEAVGTVVTKDDKSATDQLHVVREIPYVEFCTLCTGTRTEFYPTGEKRSERHIVDAELHGDWIFWHKNGRVSSQHRFVNGRVMNECQYWTEHGQPQFNTGVDCGYIHGY